MKKEMETLVNHFKSSGFVFPGSQIYGGLANSWDYGPLGIELRNNIKKLWWSEFITKSESNVGLDSAIIMNPQVWQASGHLDGFSDPLMDCKACKQRFRADHLIEQFDETVHPDGWSLSEMKKFIDEKQIKCPNCGAFDYTDIREFQLMFETHIGVHQDSSSLAYLRPETAQGIFVNYKNVQRSMRKKLPFGIGQIGKSFRNEITPGNFIFRMREFEQMELEFFCQPGSDMEWFKYYEKKCLDFLLTLGIKQDNLKYRIHEESELSHYSLATTDIEYHYPFGWGELWGIANRTDFDLKAHQNASKESMEYLDPTTNEKYVPYCIEPSVGVDRLMLAVMCDSYEEEMLENDSRIVMRFDHKLAPIKVCVLPLQKKLGDQAYEVYELVNKHFASQYDDAGNIGKRYRRQDAIGTPFCITYDFDSLTNKTVTIRHRDSMQQEIVPIDQIVEYISSRI